MNRIDENAQVYRTLAKMKRSQNKKAEIFLYMQEHAPHLLWNTFRNDRIRDCCNVLTFEDYANGSVKLRKANFCKYDKFCLACATRRSILKIQQFIDWIDRLWLHNKHWYHIVLTVKHNKNQSLNEVMDKLYEAKKKLSQRYRNSKRTKHKGKSFFHQFDWIIASVEVTYWKNWRHPHLHMIACSENLVDIQYSKYFQTKSNRVLQKEWYDITWDSYSVSIRPIDVHKNHFERTWIAEVFKYAVKFSSLEIPDLVHLIDTQKKRQYRFYSTYWCFRWIFKTESKVKNWYEKTNWVSDVESKSFEYNFEKGVYQLVF